MNRTLLLRSNFIHFWFNNILQTLADNHVFGIMPTVSYRKKNLINFAKQWDYRQTKVRGSYLFSGMTNNTIVNHAKLIKWNKLHKKHRYRITNIAYPPTAEKLTRKGDICLREGMSREAKACPGDLPATMNTRSSPSLTPYPSSCQRRRRVSMETSSRQPTGEAPPYPSPPGDSTPASSFIWHSAFSFSQFFSW